MDPETNMNKAALSDTKMDILISSGSKMDMARPDDTKMNIIASNEYKSSDELLKELFETFRATNSSSSCGKIPDNVDGIVKLKKDKKRRREEKLHKEKRKDKKRKSSKLHKENDLLYVKNSSLKTENTCSELPAKGTIHLKIKIADDNQLSNVVKREAFSVDEAFHTLGIATTSHQHDRPSLDIEGMNVKREVYSPVLKYEEDVKLMDFVVEKDQQSNNVETSRKRSIVNTEGCNDSTFEATLRKLEENRNRLLNSKNQSRLQCGILDTADDDYNKIKLENCSYVQQAGCNDYNKRQYEESEDGISKTRDKNDSNSNSNTDSRRHGRKHKSDVHDDVKRSKSRKKSRERKRGTKRSKSTCENDERNIRRVKLAKDMSPADYSTYEKCSNYYKKYYDYDANDYSYKGKEKRTKVEKSEKTKERIDKKKLFEIACKNAILMANQSTSRPNKGSGSSVTMMKTVEEFTNFCEKLSKKERREQGECNSNSNGSGSGSGTDCDSDNDTTAFSHPFQLKSKSQNIVLNIRNSVQLPVRSGQENSKQLRLQFPVSSGQDHRNNEDEWVPVVKDTSKTIMKNNEEKNKSSETVYPVNTSNEVIDVGAIVTERLNAIRKLHENPNDSTANNHMQLVNRKMNNWAASKLEPGKFIRSTGAKVLTPAQLSSGYQAWVTKDQLIRSEPVSGGVGMSLLQKMGWKPGEGLGKDKQGPTVPFAINIKVDKKGLASQEDVRGRVGYAPPVGKSSFTQESAPVLMSNKHPVSLLNEYCSKKRIDQPKYICREQVEAGRPKFAFTVQVRGMEFQSVTTYTNKKEAKSEAAALCLTSLGLLPPTA